MPFGDGTGPNGVGPTSGRGAGYCNGYFTPGCATSPMGRGAGFFGGLGRGARNNYYNAGGLGRARYNDYSSNFYPQMTKKEELDSLKNQETYMNNNMTNLKKRITDLESQIDHDSKN